MVGAGYCECREKKNTRRGFNLESCLCYGSFLLTPCRDSPASIGFEGRNDDNKLTDASHCDFHVVRSFAGRLRLLFVSWREVLGCLLLPFSDSSDCNHSLSSPNSSSSLFTSPPQYPHRHSLIILQPRTSPCHHKALLTMWTGFSHLLPMFMWPLIVHGSHATYPSVQKLQPCLEQNQ